MLIVAAIVGALRRYLFVASIDFAREYTMTKFHVFCFASIVRTTAALAALSVAAILSSPASAASLYWDNDANPVGNTVSNSGGTGLGGTGTWDTSSLKWWDGVSSDVAWT